MNELEKVFEGSDLSEDFKSKVTAILEAKEAQIREETEEKYKTLANEYAEYAVTEAEEKANARVDEEIIPMVERYIDYATEEFMKENKVESVSAAKVELAEGFLSGMTGLVENFNVKLPEGGKDALKEMEDKFNKLQARFDESLVEKDTLQDTITEMKKENVISGKTTELTESQKEKFAKTAMSVKFLDEKQFSESIDELYDSYFPSEKEERMDEQEKHDEKEKKKGLNEQENPWLSSVLNRI